jgi:hypothetical protein
MTTERNWGAEAWRAPTLQDGDVVLYSECGRIIEACTYGHGHNGVDYRSHYFTVVKREFGGCCLLVKHGGGEERFEIDYSASRAAQFLEPFDSNARYLLMHMLYQVHRKAAQEATAKTASIYKSAFIAGTLKKRKVRGQQAVKVWIERATVEEMRASLCINRVR